MLNSVPQAVNSMTRKVVINHPNSYNCTAFRKRVTRIGGSNVGGLPTIGGMAVINSDDEEAVAWDLLGNGYALKAEQFSPSSMMDRQDADNGFAEEFRFMIVSEYPGEFEPKKHDVFYLIVDLAQIAFEIVGIETTSDIPPFTQRYICNISKNLPVIV